MLSDDHAKDLASHAEATPTGVVLPARVYVYSDGRVNITVTGSSNAPARAKDRTEATENFGKLVDELRLLA